MIYAIRLKNSDMYLQEDDSYAPDEFEARCFFDFAHAKSYASEKEEVVSITQDGRIEVVS
ncbi:hypothetical protein ACPT9H_00260 [Brevibacillus borstelensis]|uniref:hypothetical protein n=1 Tax=Brevibacillus borstelensis TaxID=45462 RepID=UPI003CE533CD